MIILTLQNMKSNLPSTATTLSKRDLLEISTERGMKDPDPVGEGSDPDVGGS